MSILPAALISSLEYVKGFNKEAFIDVHQNGEPITSIRLNPEKIPGFQSLSFAEPGLNANTQPDRVQWCRNGFYLPQRPLFTVDPLFHAGAYYVQEASSMFLEEVLKQTVDLSKPLKVLDLCAAPGGKSTLIQSVITKESLLVSNEVIKTRVNILSENITKWGAANVIVTNNDPKDFQRLKNYFDVIVVDAPCSGSGLFRKNSGAISEWSENNVQHCALRQQRILADIMPSLKPGGVLIYSTCSYSQLEDEEIADWLVEQFKMETKRVIVDEGWGIVETVSVKEKTFGYRFYPDKVRGEGFFIAAFVNAADETNDENKDQRPKSKKKSATLPEKELAVLNPFLINTDDLFFISQNNEWIAVPENFENDLAEIKTALYIKKAGVRLGTVIRNELIPAHDMAVSILLDPGVMRIEVDRETALLYLRKVEFNIESDIKGWVLLTYQQLPLGWIKIMMNRINNYYPKAFRILNK